jgi:hypothetical protein
LGVNISSTCGAAGTPARRHGPGSSPSARSGRQATSRVAPNRVCEPHTAGARLAVAGADGTGETPVTRTSPNA